MADGKITIDTKIDSKGADKDLKNLTSKLKNFGKLGGAVAGVTTAMKLFSKAVKETSQLYKTQEKAEKQLEYSAKNNPYLNGASVKQLKAYASELQNISTVGDEQILPLMSQLASAGRTQAEIQDILSASIDISATGMMSLDSAVQSLNATYNGNAGLLSRQIGELKNLSAEELKSGKAIEIVKDKFKGVSEEVTKATGSTEQLKNAWGDFKETLGGGWVRITRPIEQFLTRVLTKINEINSKTNIFADIGNNSASSEDVKKELDSRQAELDALLEKQNKSLEENKNKLQEWADFWGTTIEDPNLPPLPAVDDFAGAFSDEGINRIAELQTEISVLTEEYQKLAEAEEEARKKALQQEQDEGISSRDKLRQQYDETLAKTQKEIEIRRSLGEEISKQQEAQEMLNVAVDSYVAMMSDPAFAGNSGNYSHEVNARSQIAQWTEDAKEIPEVANLLEEFKEKLHELNETEKEAKENELKLLDSQYEALSVQDRLRVWDDYVKARKKISDELQAIADAEVKAQKEKSAEMFSIISDSVSQFGSITDTMTDMLTASNEKQTNVELSKLEDQYNNGLLSYEDYCKQKEEINKESARKQYQIDMWTWTASLLQATTNIAQGVSKAIAEGGVAGIVTGALVSLAGATQIASITASKPIPPSFAHGGVIQGSNFNDGITAHVSSGEMVLNSAQQMNLWKMANGNSGSGASVNMPITIENNNGSNVSTQLDSNGLRIIVDNMVNSSMQEGRYNSSLNVANNKNKGARYL